MNNLVRCALSGYNALTDTNPDHYSLYGDVDNILIKRFSTDYIEIEDPTYPDDYTLSSITHNLSYIPFCMVYRDIYNDGLYWQIVNNQWNPFSPPDAICGINTSNLKIYNFGGHSDGIMPTAYDIFYDNMNDDTAPSIIESKSVFKVARPNKSAFSKNPNDYIVHSDLNNFKILKSGVVDLTLQGGGIYSPDSFSHGANVQEPYKYFLFIKFPDGKVAQVGGSSITLSYDFSKTVYQTWMDSTKIYIGSPSSCDVSISYIIYGSGKNGTILTDNPKIVCAKDGYSALTETNPDNINFHSLYPTLKYFTSGTYSMTVSTSTVYTIAHNLGYTPFFIGFGNDLASYISSSDYAILPYYWGRSFIGSPNNDIASFIYADDTNIYLSAYYQSSAVGTSKTFNFYYKIFKNNLGL